MKTRSANAVLVELVTSDLATARAPGVRIHEHQELVGQPRTRLLANQRLEVTPQQCVQTCPLPPSKSPRTFQKLFVDRNC